jgi:hypothetical protein
MSRLTSTFLRRSPSLFLLALLALLLWGQCAFHLNEGGGSKKSPAANLHLKTAVRLVRIDSASTRGPERFYLTIALQNLSDTPCRLASLDYALWLDKHRVGYNLNKGPQNTMLPARGEHLVTLTITPYIADTDSPGTSFKLLRAVWQQGKLAQHKARLEVFYEYYPANGKVEDANRRIKMVPLGR